MGKKRRDGRAAKRGNSARQRGNSASSAAEFILENYDPGAVYEGEVKDGNPHGRGKLKLKNGEVYDGEWKEGIMHGRGEMTYASGSIYNGEWKGDNRHGWGTFAWPSGQVYEGEWEGDQLNGKGTYRWEDGQAYEGQFVNGQMHGRGTKTWPSGKMYEGQWADGEPHGEGTETLPTGEILEGIWMKGKFAKRKLRSQRSQQRQLERGDTARHMCDYCGADDYHYKLQVCSGCNLALYCSDACQKAASGSHRRICDIISELPSRDAEMLVLKYDKDEMVDLDAGLRYGTKHMGNLKLLQINVMAMGKDDTAKISAKHLSSLLRSKKWALNSVSWVSLGDGTIPGVTENGYDVWKELRGLKQLYLCFLIFDQVRHLCTIIDQQKDTLEGLCLPFLHIDWHKAKTRRALAQGINSCKHLVKLDLDQCMLMDSDLKLMLQDLPSLRILNLARNHSNSHEFTDNTCGLIARKCPGLQELILNFHYHLSVRGIRKIFEGCPHLRSFSTSSRKLSCKDIRGLLEVAPQLLYLSLSDEVDYSCDGELDHGQELDEVIEATGGRTVFCLGSGDRAYGPGKVSSKTKLEYERQHAALRKISSKGDDPEVANEWASMLQ